MRKLKQLPVIVVMMLPFNLLAHGYWIELEGNHKPGGPVLVKLIFGEYQLGEKLSGDKLDRMKEIKVFVIEPGGSRKAIAMTQLTGWWQGSFIPENEGTYTITGINDEREVQDWTKHGLGIIRPVQYLKAIYDVNGAGKEAPTGDLIDLSIVKKGKDKYELFLQKNKQPFDTCTVSIISPAGDEVMVKTDNEGRAAFATAGKGLYLVGVQWIDNTAGVFKGKEHMTTRHKLDYSHYAE